MTIYTEFCKGNVYDVSHLRAFDLELAMQGHPLAFRNGAEVRSVREMYSSNDVLWYMVEFWGDDGWLFNVTYDKYLYKDFRLAPLAVKDNRPLHVGDKIEVFDFTSDLGWCVSTVDLICYRLLMSNETKYIWRWPTGV